MSAPQDVAGGTACQNARLTPEEDKTEVDMEVQTSW